MLSESQKKLVYQALPKTFTVKGQVLNPAFRYSNQWSGKSFPAVILNYPDEAHLEAGDVTGAEVTSSRLSLNVYAEPQRVGGVFIPAEVAVQEIARQLRDWFKSKLQGGAEISSGSDIYVVEPPSAVRNLSFVPELADREKAARSQFDVLLSYIVMT